MRGPIEVSCDYCLAEPGQRCRTIYGKVIHGFHVRRTCAYQLAKKYNLLPR